VPQFGADISFFKKISDSIPRIVLEHRDAEELRETRRRQLDAKTPDTSEISDDQYAQDEFLRFVAAMSDAIRTMDVMDQIVKNFSGSLVGDDRHNSQPLER